jgi:hypothetical protein
LFGQRLNNSSEQLDVFFFWVFSFSFIRGKGVYIHAGWMAAGRHAEGKWANGRFLAAEKKKADDGRRGAASWMGVFRQMSASRLD